MNIHELPWRMGCSRGNTSSTRWKNHQLPTPPLLFHHLHPHPDGPSASWVWKTGKPIHLLYWCFLQIVPSTKNVETSDTPNNTTGGQFAQEATNNWIVLVVGQSVHIMTYPYIFRNLMTRIYWCFWDWTHGLQHVAIRSILNWKCELFSRIFDRCWSI